MKSLQINDFTVYQELWTSFEETLLVSFYHQLLIYKLFDEEWGQYKDGWTLLPTSLVVQAIWFDLQFAKIKNKKISFN